MERDEKRAPRKGVRVVLDRRKDIERRFGRRIVDRCGQKPRDFVKRCVMGVVRKTDKRHRITCHFSGGDCIRRFMDVAVGTLGVLM